MGSYWSEASVEKLMQAEKDVFLSLGVEPSSFTQANVFVGDGGEDPVELAARSLAVVVLAWNVVREVWANVAEAEWVL